MMVSPGARVLFVHVQKTGGSTVDRILQEALSDAQRPRGYRRRRHPRLREVLRRHPDLADYWIFGFVRNPWDRLYSWHSMILRRGEEAAAGDEGVAGQIAHNRLWRPVLADYRDFERFVLEGLHELPWVGWPQLSYLRTRSRRADFIGRQERFDDDMRVVLERLGVDWPGEMPWQNAAGDGREYRDAYTPAMRDRIADVFAPDIREFDYAF